MKTVLITGSSRGIGRETAIYFAQQGWNVIIHGFRHPEKLESLKNEILEENVSCLSFCGDISDPSFVDEMINSSTFSKIDCLVNNAGISLVGLFTDATVDDWNLMINTNLTSVFTTCKNIVPHMLHHHEGKIINISSIWGDAGASCEVLYSTTKGGINHMIKLISSDMDGTLLDSYRQITPINVEAIKRAQENGINFIINTGREYPNARGLVEAAGLKCDLICSNGACAFDKDGNLLFEHILDKETVRTIFDAFNKYGMEPALFTTEGRISLLPLEEREIYTRDVFIPAIQVNHPDMKYTLDDYRELVDDVIFVDGQEALLNSDLGKRTPTYLQ